MYHYSNLPNFLKVPYQWTDLLRVPPCSNSAEECVVYDALKNLPNSGIYVGSLIDLSWISVKLPH